MLRIAWAGRMLPVTSLGASMADTGHHHNRRAFPRWKAHFEVRYGKPGNMHSARGCEIGEDGIAFRSQESFTPAMELDLAYRLEGNSDWTEVKALVCHCDGDSIGV